MIERGVYRTNFRGLHFSEGWRLGGPRAFPIFLLLKLLGHKGTYQWLPADDAEVSCSAGDLSDGARAHLEPIAQHLAELGYSAGGYSCVRIVLNKEHLDAGGYRALHRDGRQLIFVGYTCTLTSKVVSNEIVKVPKKDVHVFGSFLHEGGLSPDDVRGVSVVNHKMLLDSDGLRRTVYLPASATLVDVHRRLTKELEACRERVLAFRSLDEVKRVAWDLDGKVWERRIGRGLFYRVPPEEERQVLAACGYDSTGQRIAEVNKVEV